LQVRLAAPEIVCVAPVLAEDVRQYLQALHATGRLRRVVCSLAYGADGPVARALGVLDRLTGAHTLHRTQRRRLGPLPAHALAFHPWPELWTRAGSRLGLCRPGPGVTDRWFEGVDCAAARRLDRGVGLVVGREDGCLHTFGAAHAAGARCLYDLPIAHYATMRAVMAREVAEFPRAATHFHPAEEYRRARNHRKDRELALAGHVVVASPFVRDSLLARGVPGERITVIPYGCDPGLPAAAPAASPGRSRVLLYVGHLSLRKGTLRLLRVWKRLGAYRTHTLRLIGQVQLPAHALAEYAGTYEHLPPLPRSELARHYAAAGAFVFPSAADGFGLVLNEALAAGLPVVASSHTGAPGFITPGRQGLIYPHGADDRLGAALEQIVSDPRRTAAMGREALDLARHWTWRDYRAAFQGLVGQLLDGPLSPGDAGSSAHPGRQANKETYDQPSS
jgi:alpha-maltose-1-phosphate synthase